jgi:Holliday junction DNA helicase RuvA
MVVELRDKIDAGLEAAQGGTARGLETGERRSADDAVTALVNLGYRKKEAERAVAKAAKGGEGDLESLIRAALSLLSS